jgi:APA family basic amino acid/polyamine antiporter
MDDSAVPGLKRELGLWSAVAIVVGTVIGSGIFLVPKTMILKVGSPEMVFAVWVFAGLLSLAGALSYAELAAALPEAGGEYVYLREAYGPFWGFLYGWTSFWVAKSGGVAALGAAFVLYLTNFMPGLERALWTTPLAIGPGGQLLEITTGQLVAVALILVLAWINYFGVKVGGEVQVVVTIVKVALIGGIVVVGLVSDAGNVSNFRTEIPAPGGTAGFFAAMVAALWAYDGWNNLSLVAAEVRKPQRNLPLALAAGSLAVIVIYIITNVAYFYVLPATGVASSDRVAAEMMRRILGEPGAAAVSIAAMISILAALNGSILSGARVPYAMARDGLFFSRLRHVHPQHHTPAWAILATSVWAALLVFSGRYEQLFTYVIFSSWILYAMTGASVLVLRRKRPELVRPYRTLGYPLVPVQFGLVAICLLLSTLLESPRESLMGLGIISAGLPFYFVWSRSRGGM